MVVLCFLISAVPLCAQDAAMDRGQPLPPAEKKERSFWVCPGAEAALFSLSGAAYGGSFSAGYGSGAAVGIRAAFFTETSDSIATLELCFLFRFYFRGRTSLSGPFIQFASGPVLFAQHKDIPVPAETGRISAGIGLGWRFMAGERWFIESSFRFGYPFLAGGGICAGLCL